MDKTLKLIIYRNSLYIKSNIFKMNFQTGGGEKLTVKYKDHEYIFENAMDDNHYVLYSHDEFECVAVVISKTDKIAEIHGIGNYKSCIIDTNTNVGSFLLNITIKMIKKYKDKFDINYILLTDNSLKSCNNKKIKLSTMLTLLTGDTWYAFYLIFLRKLNKSLLHFIK
jgi:hypothetical protein